MSDNLHKQLFKSVAVTGYSPTFLTDEKAEPTRFACCGSQWVV